MRCKKHLSDLSSSVGVCSSCLRERLCALIAAQAQAQAHAQAQTHLSRASEDPRKSDPNPPPLSFPRSVSPYVSRRKSDGATTRNHHHHHAPGHAPALPDNYHLQCYSTPQIGPTFSVSSDARSYKQKRSRFSFFSNLFRSRSEKFESDPRVPYRDSSASSSPSWFSAIFSTRRDKESAQFYPDGSIGVRKPRARMDRGMSPVRGTVWDCDYDEDGDRSPSGSGYSSESSQTWKRTPVVAPPSARRTRQGQNRNMSGLAFCLSPLVRASPNHHWNQKGLPPEVGKSGEPRASRKPHLSTAASFCKNRSRKLADFGRTNQNR
ncbi:hypothetical protein UlMin_036812 [Ulmus minor]